MTKDNTREALADCPDCGNSSLAIRTDIYKDKREFIYCDCCGAMANRSMWQRAALTSTPEATQAATGGEVKLYAECRECQDCGHAGINDSHDTESGCNTCGWSGPTPEEDKCPECLRIGTMTTVCPECSGRYVFITEAYLTPPSPPQAAQAQPQAVQASLPEYTMSRYASSADLHAAMVAEIIRLRAALVAQAVPAGRPIETAPKDGRPLLLNLPPIGGWAAGWWRCSWSFVCEGWCLHTPHLINGKAVTMVGIGEATEWAPLP